MPGPRYTPGQLERLRDSPLVFKPDNLPLLEQWFDQPIDQKERRPKTQGGIHGGKTDENDHPIRPSFFETRQLSRHSHTGTGDDFLGPKISFASASAARQPSNTAVADDKNHVISAEDTKGKHDRVAGREGGFRDRDGRDKGQDRFRSRFENGDKQGVSRRFADDSPRTKDKPRDGEEDANGESDRRRSGLGRSKFEQPWFRDGEKTETKVREGAELGADRSWRDNERRNEHNDRDWANGPPVEQDPAWLQDSTGGEMGHTQEDFQKWKEKMKASEEGPSVTETVAPSSAVEEKAPTPPPNSAGMDNVFGLWAGPKREEVKGDSGAAGAKVPAARPKSSRFAGMFGKPQIEPAQPEAAAPVDEPALAFNPSVAAADATPEDKQGLQNILNMLRMGGGSSNGLSAQMFARPPGSIPAEPRPQPPFPTQSEERVPQQTTRHSIPPTDQMPRSQPSQPAQPLQPSHILQPQQMKPPARPEPGRDTDFLLNLMKQQRAPFTEGQIYGQSYNRKDPYEINALLANLNVKGQPQKPRGPPPGFYENNGSFASNQQLPQHDMPDLQQSKPMQRNPMEDRSGLPGRRPPQDEQRFQQPLNFGPPAQPFPQGRPQSQVLHESIAPPPGFQPSGRGPAPPGFFPFPGNAHQPSHQQGAAPPQPSRGTSLPPPSLQQPPPPQQQLQVPSYYNINVPGVSQPGLPAGYLSMQGLGALQPQRRPPQMHIPPGYPGYGDVSTRGPSQGPGGPLPLPHQQQQTQQPQQQFSQYAQYQKQGGY